MSLAGSGHDAGSEDQGNRQRPQPNKRATESWNPAVIGRRSRQRRGGERDLQSRASWCERRVVEIEKETKKRVRVERRRRRWSNIKRLVDRWAHSASR